MSKAISLSPKQIERVLQSCLLMQNSESKRCILVLSHTVLRVSEIGLLETKTILFLQLKPRKMQDGSVIAYRACDALEALFRSI